MCLDSGDETSQSQAAEFDHPQPTHAFEETPRKHMKRFLKTIIWLFKQDTKRDINDKVLKQFSQRKLGRAFYRAEIRLVWTDIAEKTECLMICKMCQLGDQMINLTSRTQSIAVSNIKLHIRQLKMVGRHQNKYLYH